MPLPNIPETCSEDRLISYIATAIYEYKNVFYGKKPNRIFLGEHAYSLMKRYIERYFALYSASQPLFPGEYSLFGCEVEETKNDPLAYFVAFVGDSRDLRSHNHPVERVAESY